MHLPGDALMGAPEYFVDMQADPREIADLRDAVGWNRMEEAYRRPEMRNLFEIGVRQNQGQRGATGSRVYMDRERK